MPTGAAVLRRYCVAGATPAVSTNGRLVKRDNSCFASRDLGFDSLTVHQGLIVLKGK